VATEALEYKISFDTSEVAQKLSEVKNAMDVAFGAQAFNTAGADAYPFQGMFNGATSMASSAMTSAQQGVQMAQGTFSDMRNVFNTAAETSRLGYSKFMRDMEMTGLMSGSMRGAPEPMTYGQQVRQISQGSFWDDVTGGLGMGYSPTMPMSKKEYTRRHKAERLDDFMEPSWGEAIGVGVAAAFAGGPVGWGMVGIGAAALGTKAALYPFTSELRHQRALENYVGGTSWRFLSGEFGREDKEDIGKFLRELPDQPNIGARDYGRSEVDEIVSTFTEAGGFDYVRNAREYKEKTKQIFEGHRELMHTLHIASKEAATLMGQLSRDLGIESFSGFSAETGVLADRAGLTRTEAASFIMKSAEMVRGTGYEMKGFALGAGRLLEDVRDMARTGLLSQEDIRQFGGEQNIALSMARSAMNFAGSPTGFVSQAALMSAQLGGGGLEEMASMGIQGQLSAAAGLLSSPMAYARFFGRQQELVDEMGPEFIMQQKTMRAIEEAQMTFGQKAFTSRDLYGALKATGKYSHQEITEMVAIRDAAGRDDIPTVKQDFYNRGLEAIRQMEEEGESPAGKWLRETEDFLDENIWGEITGFAEAGYLEIERGTKIVTGRTGRFFSDITGGIFETISKKPGGIASRWRMGGDFAERHKAAMAIDERDQDVLQKRILDTYVEESSLKVATRVELTEEERRRLPGGGTKVEEVTLDRLEAKEAQKELERYLEGSGRYTAMVAVGRTGIAAVDIWSTLMTGLTHQSDISSVLEQTEKDLELETGELQVDISRSFATSAIEYFKKVELGDLDVLDPSKTSLKDYQISKIEADYKNAKISKKQKKQLIKVLGGMTPEESGEFTRAGFAQWRKDYETEEFALEELAKERLEEKDIENPTWQDIEMEKLSIGEDDLLASWLGMEGKTVTGRAGAAAKMRKSLAGTIAAGAQLFSIKDQTTGHTVFDREGAEMANAVNNMRSMEFLEKMADRGLEEAKPMYVKTV